MGKRDRWTEDDVDGLASEEPDVFDRKSGLLYDDLNKLRSTLGKAVSAFANSGGGSLVLGVEDNGVPDGLPKQHGKTAMRDWIEQIVPTLVDYPLSDFRVHTVIPKTPSRIPVDKVVIVVDVGDSAMAPHQSKSDSLYYHREGGRSVPAKHFYLELLRQRLTNPVLKAELMDVIPLRFSQYNGGLFFQAKLKFHIDNVGHFAAHVWQMILREIDHPTPGYYQLHEGDFYFDKSSYPVHPHSSGGIRIDSTILPGMKFREEKDIAWTLRMEQSNRLALREELENKVTKLRLTYQIATENSPGERIEFFLDPAFDISRAINAAYSSCPEFFVDG